MSEAVDLNTQPGVADAHSEHPYRGQVWGFSEGDGAAKVHLTIVEGGENNFAVLDLEGTPVNFDGAGEFYSVRAAELVSALTWHVDSNDEVLVRMRPKSEIPVVCPVGQEGTPYITLEKSHGTYSPIEGLTLDDENSRVIVDGRDIGLSRREYKLFRRLAENINRPVSSRELLAVGWGVVTLGEAKRLIKNKNVANTIRQIRESLGEGLAQHLIGVNKVGYVLVDDLNKLG